MSIRMRFPQQAFEELKKEDPDTPITLNYIRRLSASGLIPVVMIGRRRLLNYDALLEFLRNPTRETIEGKMRRIQE